MAELRGAVLAGLNVNDNVTSKAMNLIGFSLVTWFIYQHNVPGHSQHAKIFSMRVRRTWLSLRHAKNGGCVMIR